MRARRRRLPAAGADAALALAPPEDAGDADDATFLLPGGRPRRLPLVVTPLPGGRSGGRPGPRRAPKPPLLLVPVPLPVPVPVDAPACVRNVFRRVSRSLISRCMSLT